MRLVSTRVALSASVLLLGCASSHAAEREWHPVPDVPPDSAASVRGTADAAGKLTNDDQAEIVSRVLRTFYYPGDRQVRWLDPRPLAHVRTQAADDTVGADPDFADDVMASVHGQRFCILGGPEKNCKDRPGGVVRFSWPYRVGADSAIVFATYSPRDSTGKTSPVQSEMQFRMQRNSDDEWDMVGKNAVTVFGRPAAGASKSAGKPGQPPSSV